MGLCKSETVAQSHRAHLDVTKIGFWNLVMLEPDKYRLWGAVCLSMVWDCDQGQGRVGKQSIRQADRRKQQQQQ